MSPGTKPNLCAPFLPSLFLCPAHQTDAWRSEDGILRGNCREQPTAFPPTVGETTCSANAALNARCDKIVASAPMKIDQRIRAIFIGNVSGGAHGLRSNDCSVYVIQERILRMPFRYSQILTLRQFISRERLGDWRLGGASLERESW